MNGVCAAYTTLSSLEYRENGEEGGGGREEEAEKSALAIYFQVTVQRFEVLLLRLLRTWDLIQPRVDDKRLNQ